jgi:hypothetical protein
MIMPPLGKLASILHRGERPAVEFLKMICRRAGAGPMPNQARPCNQRNGQHRHPGSASERRAVTASARSFRFDVLDEDGMLTKVIGPAHLEIGV